MKYQTIIGNHYFHITAGFQHAFTFLSELKSLGGHAKKTSQSLKSVSFHLACKRRSKRSINM